VRSLEDPAPSVRIRAAAALREIGPPALPAAGRLGALALDDANQDARGATASALGRIDPDAAAGLVAPLLRGLAAGDVQGRRAAAVVLGNLGPVAKPAVPALVDALASDDALLRNRAVQALAAIGIPAASVVPALTRALDDPEFHVRHAAAAAFAFSLPGDACAAAAPRSGGPPPARCGASPRWRRSGSPTSTA